MAVATGNTDPTIFTILRRILELAPRMPDICGSILSKVYVALVGASRISVLLQPHVFLAETFRLICEHTPCQQALFEFLQRNFLGWQHNTELLASYSPQLVTILRLFESHGALQLAAKLGNLFHCLLFRFSGYAEFALALAPHLRNYPAPASEELLKLLQIFNWFPVISSPAPWTEGSW